MYRSIAVATAAWLCLLGQPARAQTMLTLEDVIARARDQAAAVAIARARVGEAEAAVGDAVRRRDNPLLSAALGPRRGNEQNATDLSVGVSQQFEGAGQRRARLDVARAAADRQRAATPQAARQAAIDAGSTFIRALAAKERVQIARDADTISRRLLTATERRYAVGDIAAIDVNLARIDAARSAAAAGMAGADLDEALATLRSLLRLPPAEPIDVRGSLAATVMPPIAELEAAVSRRPELAALEAELAEADAQVRLGQSLRRPDLGATINYEREASDTIVLAGLTVTLPAFQRGQGTLAAGLARASRIRLEHSLVREQALAELTTAYSLHEAQRRIAEAFVRDAMASVADNESLAQRSFDAGEIDLMDLLLIRRDAIDTRRSAVDRWLEAALSRLRMDAAAGVWQ